VDVDGDADEDPLDRLLGARVKHLLLDRAVVRDPGDEDELGLSERRALLLVRHLEVDEAEAGLGLASAVLGGEEGEAVLLQVVVGFVGGSYRVHLDELLVRGHLEGHVAALRDLLAAKGHGLAHLEGVEVLNNFIGDGNSRRLRINIVVVS